MIILLETTAEKPCVNKKLETIKGTLNENKTALFGTTSGNKIVCT
jgi:hypothetical protein